MRCSIITPVGPGHEILFNQCNQSIQAAIQHSQGPFQEISTIVIDDTAGNKGRSSARNEAVRRAKSANIEWLFFLDADDLLFANAFELISKCVNGYDGIWGIIVEIQPGSNQTTLRMPQILTLKNIKELLLLDPYMTLQMGHFVRTDVAVSNPFNELMNTGEDFDYYLRIWSHYRCIKIREPLFVNRRGFHSIGPRSADGRQWRMAAEQIISTYLQKYSIDPKSPECIQIINDKIREFNEFVKKLQKQSHQSPENKISLLCPTRGRPDLAWRLTQSVIETALLPGRVEILFYVDQDDDQIEGYRKIFSADQCTYGSHLTRCTPIYGKPMSVSKSWNILAANCYGDTLAMTNDDQVFVDKGWDIRLDQEIKKFPDEIYCMWFNDGLNGPNHCAFPIVSRKWYETLGYFTPGIFEFLYNDTWIMDIAKRIGRLNYIGDVLVEHRHFTTGKSSFDETYQRHRTGHARDRIMRDNLCFQNTDKQREEAAFKLFQVIKNFKEMNK